LEKSSDKSDIESSKKLVWTVKVSSILLRLPHKARMPCAGQPLVSWGVTNVDWEHRLLEVKRQFDLNEHKEFSVLSTIAVGAVTKQRGSMEFWDTMEKGLMEFESLLLVGKLGLTHESFSKMVLQGIIVFWFVIGRDLPPFLGPSNTSISSRGAEQKGEFGELGTTRGWEVLFKSLQHDELPQEIAFCAEPISSTFETLLTKSKQTPTC